MKNKPITILITGGAGYIGSYLAQYLHEKGYNIIIYDNLSTGHQKNIQHFKLYHGDLNQADILEECFLKENPGLVIHLAAKALVHESEVNPYLYYKNNVAGSLALMGMMLKYACKHIIFSSSGASYGESLQTPMLEDHPQNPVNTYGLTKLMFEHVLADMGKKKLLSSVVFRFFNAAGEIERFLGGEDHEPETHFIPNLCKKALTDQKISIFGSNYPTHDGTCVRDYVHVEDLCHAHYLGIKYLLHNKTSLQCNLGLGKGYSLLDVIHHFEKVSGIKLKIEYQENRPGDPAKLYASIEKAKRYLSWEPQKNLEDIIRSAWAYHSKSI